MHSLAPLARRRLFQRLRAVVLSVGSAFAVAACSSAATENVGASESELTASAVVSRAEQWANAALAYCQSPYGELDPDDSCWSQPWESGHRCYRTSNSAWNPYRSDCSGLISWAWALPAPGRTTEGFAPFQTDITHAISASALQPGDAVNNSDHVMLFKAWVTPGARAVFIEEPGCSTVIKHAQEITSNVSIRGTTIHVDQVGMTFTAIRYVGIGGSGGGRGGGGGGGGGCVVGGLYCGGDKVSGSASTLYRCTGGRSGVVAEQCATGCSVNAGRDDACNGGGGGGGDGSGGCSVGGLYCGGDRVSGDPSTLYRCTAGSAGVAITTCAHGCEVRAGQDDACRGSGGCFVGGNYCGGDEVTGDPRTLYRCTGGSTGVVVARCANGCEVRAGTNDACR